MKRPSSASSARGGQIPAFAFALSTIVVSILALAPVAAMGQSLSPLEQLGKRLFFDTNLSTPPGQSCAACHGPEVGFTGPSAGINAAGGVYPGAVANRFGNRKPPSAAYAGDSSILHYDADDGVWEGGMFWDGRATGWTLGDPLAEQARGPFLNPLEQNNPGAKQVVTRVSKSNYAGLFVQVWGPGSLDPTGDVDGSYSRIARSIAAYERSAEVNPFSSKYDYYLKGEAKLTKQEQDGLELFEGKANCAACHVSRSDRGDEPPLFTDFTYDNLGIPKNPKNPFYSAPARVNPSGSNWIDGGLGGFLASQAAYADQAAANLGRQKVPTLRNVDLRPSPGFVKAFGHNGYFKSLDEIVHFYNTRDVQPWPAPEVAATVNHSELGNLGLSLDEEAAVVAFLKTLSDGYVSPVNRLAANASGVALEPGNTVVELAPIRPNPASAGATITFSVPASEAVELTVYDLGGRVVRELASGPLTAGSHTVVWDGRDRAGARVASGAYFCRLHVGDVNQVRKLMWLW
jgi:cytochrome c peroxidase